MTILDIISIFVVVANLSLGFFVWWKGKKKKANIWFFLLTIAVAGWVLFNWLSIIYQSHGVILWTCRLTFAFAGAIPVILLNFVVYFSKKIDFPKVLLMSLNIIGIIYVAISGMTTLVIKDVNLNTLYHNVYRGPLFHSFGLLFIIFIVTALILLIRQYQISDRLMRLKLKYMIYSFIIVAAVGTFTNLIWPELVYFFKGNQSYNFTAEAVPSVYGPLFTIIMTIGMAYGIMRYRLLDIRVIIRKGFVNFLSLAILLFVYIYLLIISKDYFEKTYNLSDQTTTIGLVIIIALTIEPLRRFLVKVIDKAFYAKRKSAREEARKLRIVLTSSLQFDQLVQKVAGELQSFLDVADIKFLWHDTKIGVLASFYPKNSGIEIKSQDPLFKFLRDHPGIIVTEEIPYMVEEANVAEAEELHSIEATLKHNKVGLVLPVGEKGELIGAFLLSQKHGKEAFTSDNIEYLSSLQFQMTNAIASALLYKQAVERIGKV